MLALDSKKMMLIAMENSGWMALKKTLEKAEHSSLVVKSVSTVSTVSKSAAPMNWTGFPSLTLGVSSTTVQSLATSWSLMLSLGSKKVLNLVGVPSLTLALSSRTM